MYACEIYHGGPLEIDRPVFVENVRKIDQIVVFFDKIALLRQTKLYTWISTQSVIPNY